MSMHVVQVGAGPDPARRSAEELLAAWPTLADVARAVARAGARVTVVQAAADDAHIERDGVDYHFVRVPGRRRGARAMAAAVARLRPDVVHVHGLGFPLHVHALRRALPAVPLLVQDHADQVASGLRLHAARLPLRGVDAAAFTARSQAEPFLAAGMLARNVRIVEVPESSSHFTPGDRAAARHAFGLGEEPCVAWVGRLTEVKDPLLALRVFRNALDCVPDARLLCAFGDDALRPQLEQALMDDPRLRARVSLLGALQHTQIEMLLRAADVFLASSRREGSGFALIEALACGTTPVVTDIPAFRALTAGGAVARLFPPGDADRGGRALVEGLRSPVPRQQVRAHFEQHVSFERIGRSLVAACEDLIQARRVRAPAVQPRPTARRRRVVLLVPGGVDRSGTERVIPCVLALIERLARSVDLHVLALRQEARACDYDLLGAHVQCVPAASRSAGVRALLRLHRERKIDVMHALWMHPQGTSAALAGAMLGVPVVLHLNGGDLAAIPSIGFGGRATLPGRARLRAAVAGATRVTVPSEAAARQARALGIEAEVLTLGVARDRWPSAAPRPRDPRAPMRLLSVADLRPVKDHALLLRAVALLVQQGRDVRLDCIGHDTMGGAVQRLSRELSLTHVVRFHEPAPFAALRAHVDTADALVVASLHEGDPIAALEAAVAGLPVVGTAVGHLETWSAAGAALTCPPADASGLAACIARIMDDDALRLRLARNAQKMATACDADAGAARVLELYDELAAVTGSAAAELCPTGPPT